MKRGAKLLILLAVLVVGIGGYVLVRALTAEKPVEVEVDPALLPVEIPADEIVKFEWSFEGQDFTLEKDGEDWRYTPDPSFPLDPLYPRSMVSAVSSLKATQAIHDPEDLAEYGLDAPWMNVQVTRQDGSVDTLSFGYYHDLTQGYYLQVNGGEDTVWMVGYLIAGAFSYDLLDLAKGETWNSISNVQALQVQTQDGRMELERVEEPGTLSYTDKHHWFTEVDGDMKPLGTSKVSTLYTKVTGLSWERCVNYKAVDADLAQYGLDLPLAMATVEYLDADGNRASLALEIGDYLEEENVTYSYARLQGSQMVYLIAGSVADGLLAANYESLQPDEVCPLNWDTLTAFEVTLDGETHRVDVGETHEETDDKGNAVQVTSYSSDGAALATGDVSALLNTLSATYASETADKAGGRSEELSFTFYRNTETYSEMELSFDFYDTTRCLVRFAGQATQLVSRETVDELKSLVATMLQSAG